ncbi:MAG: hydrogenase nickel incorporation protein HypB [Planctomycetes bacterium]|nr:hydrogenase nickel incorporation protein HypB [Planctomycetota bacterium]
MCRDCGCEEGNKKIMDQIHGHVHSHDHTHSHSHAAGHSHSHAGENAHSHSHDHSHDDAHSHSHDHSDNHSHQPSVPKTLQLEHKVLARNDQIADMNRAWFEQRELRCINIISSPGSGKTMLLEKSLDALQSKGVHTSVVVGDQQTDNDARRLSGKGAKVMQVNTHSSCHLNAEQVQKVLPDVIHEETELFIVENVGNLVCPAAFDLGENCKIALLSVTEGEDKPLKYPVLFATAECVVISKIDLLEHVDFCIETCVQNLRKINPKVTIIKCSARSGEGMDSWMDWLLPD